MNVLDALKSGKLTIRATARLIGGTKLTGDFSLLWGDATELSGDCSGLRGDCSGLRGNCTELSGDCSGLRGDCSGAIKAFREQALSVNKEAKP
jgi:hypothetical protein